MIGIQYVDEVSRSGQPIGTMMQQQTNEANERKFVIATSLPATRIRLLLHPGGRNGLWRTSDPHSGAGIDYGDSITRADSGRLMYLHLMGVVV